MEEKDCKGCLLYNDFLKSRSKNIQSYCDIYDLSLENHKPCPCINCIVKVVCKNYCIKVKQFRETGFIDRLTYR